MRHPLIGRTLAGKFTLESLLGTGAMGAVFRARHVALDGYIAVKVMHKEIAAEETFAQRFRREARAASRLDHANVIRVIDFGIEPDGSHYIAMEYVDGPDLFQVMKTDGPLPQERVVAIMTQVLSGVAAAHDTGVIHRDLKPENIMVSSRVDDDGVTNDVVKVCDFGIAQLSDPNPSAAKKKESQRTLTTRGVLLGTPQYMSPEQARGEQMDARTDIYSLGVILYQMLADQLPFEGPTPIDVVLKHISEDAVPPSTHRKGVSPHLESVCMKALSKKREARFTSAREMRAALRADGMTPVVSAASARLSTPTHTLPSAAPAAGPPTGLDLTHDDLAAAAFRPELKRSLVYASTALGLSLLGGLLFVAFGGVTAQSGAAPRPAESAPPSTPARIDPGSAQTAVAPPVSAEHAVNAETHADEHAPLQSTKTPPGRRPSPTVAAVQPKGAQPASEHVAQTTESVATHEAPSDLHEPPSSTAAPVAAQSEVTPPADTKPRHDNPPSTTALRPESGRVKWRVAAVGGGATAGGVQRAVGRTAGGFTSCYQKGLRARGKAVNAEGTLRLVCDEQGRVVSATLSGAGMPDVADCIRGLVTGITIPNADTGEAWATIAMTLSVTD